MTRDEAMRKWDAATGRVPDCDNPCDEHPHFVDALAALGILKLDEPKDVRQRFKAIVRCWGFVTPDIAEGMFNMLDAAGLTIIDKKEADRG